MCVNASSFSNRLLWRQMAQVPPTPVFELQSCRCIASLSACVFCCGCVPPCVRVPRQCQSPQRPGLVLRPLMVSERGAPADRAWNHLGTPPPDNAEANRRHFVFYGFFNAGLTHCFLYCLIKNTLIFLTVHCGHSGRTLHCNQ